MKKNIIKKSVITVFCCFCLIVGVMTVLATDTIKVSAEEMSFEWESNNIITEANEVSVNTVINGNIVKSGDVDWYAFSVAKDGVVWLTFDHEYINDGYSFWDTSFYDANQTEIAYDNWYGDATKSKDGKKVGLREGTYYIKVREGSYRHSSNTYKIIINYVESDYWEKGLNETIVKADAIPVNTEINGSLSLDNDVDWYSFTLPANGSFNISFDHEYIDDSYAYWRTALFTSDNKEIVCYSWVGNTLNKQESGGRLGVPAGTYYLRIFQGQYRQTSIPYRFTINYSSSEGCEKEFNDIVVTANKISLNTIYHGSVMHDSDLDWYVFELTAPGKIRLMFNHSYIDDGYGYWEYTFLDSNNKSISESQQISGSSMGNQISDAFVLDKGVYYLRIKDGPYRSSNIDYAFSVDYSADGSFTNKRIDLDNLTDNSNHSDVPEMPVNNTDTPANDTNTPVDGSKTPVDDTKPSDTAKTEPTPSEKTEAEDASSVKIGTVLTDGTLNYKVTYDDEVVVTGLKDKNVTTIVIPASIKYKGVKFEIADIAKNAFANNKKITRVTIKADLDTIGENAFSGCEGMTRVDLVGDITTIGRKAFYKCKKLSQIYITTDSIEEVGSKAFSKIKQAVAIKVPKGMKKDYTTLFKKGGLPKKAQIKE